jgi:uncharacterized caspase-like protein
VLGGFARVDAVANELIAFASSPNKVALDGSGDHSPFTAALLDHLEKPDVHIEDMMIDVRNAVLAATADRQLPWSHSCLRQRFFFAPGEHLVPPKASVRQSAEKQLAVVLKRPTIADLMRLKLIHPELGLRVDEEIERLRFKDEERRRKDAQGVAAPTASHANGPAAATSEWTNRTHSRLQRILGKKR